MSSMLILRKSRSPVLVMINSICVSICNHFHAGEANIGKITTFTGYPSLTPACAGLVKRRGSGHKLLKYIYIYIFNAENFIRRLS